MEPQSPSRVHPRAWRPRCKKEKHKRDRLLVEKGQGDQFYGLRTRCSDYGREMQDLRTVRFRPRACGGCGAALAARLVTKAAGTETIVVSSTGCMEVFSTPYPETAWKVPWIHSLFENAAAVASGIEAALKKQGRKEKIVIMAGDGATFDIGMICISGAFERGHDFTYICYDNEAYMNTGIQRSGATPYDASTTTSPAGTHSFGNKRPKKDMPAILQRTGSIRCNRLYRVPCRSHAESRESDQHARALLRAGPCAVLYRLGVRRRTDDRHRKARDRDRPLGELRDG